MVNDLNHQWPIMGETRFAEVAQGLARAVRASNPSRSWPTINTLLKALNVAIAPPVVVGFNDEAAAKERAYQFVKEWWIKHGDTMPRLARMEHAQRLVSDGVATWGKLHRKCFPLPDWAYDLWMNEPDPNHEALLADIRALGEQLRANRAPQGNIIR
jgi:hypothetical protein